MRELAEIVEALDKSIDPKAIQKADASRGIFGDYITAQYAMQLANEIFGVDGIHDIEILHRESIEIQKPGEIFGDWTFWTDVKVTFALTVKGQLTFFHRVGRGVGVAQAPWNRKTNQYEPVKPQQLDTGIKSSLSDAIKNALMRTGRQLGAELYFDERMAQALGYENFSGRAAEQSEREMPSDLGEMVCERGWGKEKKFEGMSLAEIYADEDGFGAMKWASGLDKPRGFSAHMKTYYLQRQAQGEEEASAAAKRVADKEQDDRNSVMMWYGESKPADGFVDWPAIKKSPGFVKLLGEKMNPEGEIANFGPDHPRFKNHLKRHFHIDKGDELTWSMLQALYTYCKEGSEKAEFGWPKYYGGDRAPTQASLEKENPPEPEPEPDTWITIGPQQNQKIPSVLQIEVKSAGVSDPDDWIWATIGEPVGEWEDAHTEVLRQVVKAVGASNIPVDNTGLSNAMWKVGLANLEA